LVPRRWNLHLYRVDERLRWLSPLTLPPCTSACTGYCGKPMPAPGG
jgi:hypothetical protein